MLFPFNVYVIIVLEGFSQLMISPKSCPEPSLRDGL